MIHIRRFPLVGLCALAVACASWRAPAAGAQTLREIDLSSPAALGTRIESVRGADGAPAIRVTAAWPVVVNLAEVPDPNVDATRLVFEARARAEGLAGAAFLEIWCHFPDGKQYFGRGLDSTVTGSGDWTTIRTTFLLEAGQRPSKVTLNLVVNGRGSVSIAQARLVKADR